MTYVSKVTPAFFIVALINLVTSLIFLSLPGFSTSFFVTAVFGFIGSTMMGAMYQIVPNSQNRKLSFEPLSYLVFAGVVSSLSLFYVKLYTTASLSYSFFLFIFALHMLVNVKNWMPVTVRFLGVSILYLFLSSLFLFLHFLGYLPFQLAIHTFTLGSMLNAVYGVEVAWIPMLMMEAINIKKLNRLFYAKLVSTPLLLIAFYKMDYSFISLLSVFEIGVAAYFIYLLYDMFSKRRMSTPPPPAVKIFMSALILLPIGLVVGFIMASSPRVLQELLYVHVFLLVYGFTALTIFGGMFHLLPRVVWNWKLSGKPNAPTINQLVEEKAVPGFIFTFFLFLSVSLMLSTLEPLRFLSPLPYIIGVFMFFKITFLSIYKKLTEVKDGSSKQADR